MIEIDYSIPEKLLPLVTSEKRYNVIYGGRGSSKSWGIALLMITKAMAKKSLILCTRQIQNTIKDSVHKLLAETIDRLKLTTFFDVTRETIVCKLTGSSFIFKGLNRNISEIKSTEGIDYCWVEEAHAVSVESWDTLIPTVRKPDSQFFIGFNPYLETDPVWQMFCAKEHPDARVIKMNYSDNPFFPEVLRKEMEYLKKVNYNSYLNTWLGEFKKHSDACIFTGKYLIDSFETPAGVDFFYGADWGFSNDPTTLIRFFIRDNILYVDYEAWGIGVELNELTQLFESVPGSRLHKIIADNARPEIISFMGQNGFTIYPSKKGAGTIKDGIEFLRSFEKIIIHPRCAHTAQEFSDYSYKIDKITGQILPIIVDANNHTIDAIRYASEDLRRYNTKMKIPAYDIGSVLGW